MKICSFILVLLLVFSVSSTGFAAESSIYAQITDSAIINTVGFGEEQSINKYPLVIYKDITYLPLTYYHLNITGLNLDVKDDKIIVEQDKIAEPKPWGASGGIDLAKSHIKACLSPFKLIINNHIYDEQYPILFYRDIVYMPLTWKVAVDWLNWDYSFGENGLELKSDAFYYTMNGDSYISESGGYVSVANESYYKNGDTTVYVSTKTNRLGPYPQNMVIKNADTEIKIEGFVGYYQKNGPIFTVSDEYVYTNHYSKDYERQPLPCKINIKTGEVTYLN